MAVFSINNHLQLHHLNTTFPLRTFSNVVKSHFNLQVLKNLNSNPAVPVPPIFAAPRAAVSSADLASTLTDSLAKFSENVSGEWDGFGADFTAEGNPIELPESVVPEAYREWEVKVFDWQTQCPTLAQSDGTNLSFMYKTIKLLPTVGCEADAATRYAIHERHVTTAALGSPFAYHTTGCYVALWPLTNQLMELEHCLIDPGDRESRVRIIQVLTSRESELKLQSVRVFVEQWYGPFRNGDQLGGCAVRNSAFATTQPLKASQVSRAWRGHTAVATFSNSHHMIQQLADGFVCDSIRDEDENNIVLLPNQLWCSLKRTEDMETQCKAGWLLGRGHALTSKCTFSSTGELREIAVATETAIPA